MIKLYRMTTIERIDWQQSNIINNTGTPKPMASSHINDKNTKLYSFSSSDANRHNNINRSNSNVSRTCLNNGTGDSGHDTSPFTIMVTNGHVTNGGGSIAHHTKTSQKNNNGLHHNSSKHMHSSPNIWTTSTSRSSSKSNFTSGTNDFHYIQASDINGGKSATLPNGSTSKLLPYDDQSNKQVSECPRPEYHLQSHHLFISTFPPHPFPFTSPTQYSRVSTIWFRQFNVRRIDDESTRQFWPQVHRVQFEFSVFFLLFWRIHRINAMTTSKSWN